jgi:SAM-dependent methyltransferase
LFPFLLRYPLAPSLALWRSAEAQLFSALQLEEPVLDIGCGNGYFAEVALHNKIHSAIEIDLSQVKQAAVHDKYTYALVADANRLPYKNGHFATVISNCVMEHIRDIEAALEEIQRVLTPGGKFFFTVPTQWFAEWFYLSWLLKKLHLNGQAEKQVQRYNRRQLHFHLYSVEEWEGLLQRSGLRLVRHTFYAPRSFQFVFSALDDITHLLGEIAAKKSSSSERRVSRASEKVAAGLWGRFLARFWQGLLSPLSHRCVLINGMGAGALIQAEKPALGE